MSIIDRIGTTIIYRSIGPVGITAFGWMNGEFYPGLAFKLIRAGAIIKSPLGKLTIRVLYGR